AYMDRYYQLRRAGLPLHISAFKGRIAGLVADDANEDAAIALLQLARTELPTHEDHIIDTFTLGDCWALTLALCDTYQGMTPYVLESEDGECVHTFAHDDRTGLYVDINGPQSLEEVHEAWGHDHDWDDLVPLSDSSASGHRKFPPRPDAPSLPPAHQ